MIDLKSIDIIKRNGFTFSEEEKIILNYLYLQIKRYPICSDKIFSISLDTVTKYMRDYLCKEYSVFNIRNNLISIRDKSILIKIDGIETTISIIDKVWFDLEQSQIQLLYNKEGKELFEYIYSNNYQDEIHSILNFQCKYSIKFYRLLKINGKKTYSIDALRKYLDIEDDVMVRYPDFRRYILERVQKELKSVMGMDLEYEPIYIDRRVSEVTLCLY